MDIYPSLISADLLNLESTIKALEPYCAGFHLDIMDNHFVPNLTMGAAFANALAGVTTKQLWVHLMVENPESIIRTLQLPEGSIVTFHIESTKKIKECIAGIREKKWLAGIALKPKTPLADIFEFLPLVGQALIMSVEPGFSGQQFLEETVGRFRELAEFKKNKNLSFTLAADGGVNHQNLGELKRLGVTQAAVASAIFDAADPVEALKKLSGTA